MDKLRIHGGRPLNGEVVISGAKNAALPELCAALLTAGRVTLANLPQLHDVDTMLKLLRVMGLTTTTDADGALSLNASDITTLEAPYDLVKTMRASILVLGPLLARFGEAKVSLPGGCAIGTRPVDQHIKGLQAMGAEISVEHGYIVAKADRSRGGLKGARITTDMVTVTGTENLMMAAALADGETVLENAAQEPEIFDLAEMLIAMGARIEGHGTSRIRIEGVRTLGGVTHRVVPDRIEAGTFLCAVAAAGGDVVLRRARADHLGAVIDKLREAGTTIDAGDDWVRIRSDGRLRAVSFRTSEYPAYPTDMQAQLMALDCIGEGSASITETIFENRFNHVNELMRLGAKIEVDGRVAMVQGVANLSGATVMATDLRASAGLVIAGLVAEGETIVDRIYHLDRGYDRMEVKLREIGAAIDASDDLRARPAMITIALSKGRILDDALPLLRAAGIELAADVEASRELIVATSRADVRIVLVRASDVPTYVQYGGADLGIVGRDTLLEHGGEGLYQPLDLQIAKCRMSVATRADFDYATAVKQGSRIRVATKFTRVARDHFADKGVHVDLIKLYGSMELAPLTGLADAIVDLVASGHTLRANGLVEVEQIMPISARLVVNKAALKLNRVAIRAVIDAVEAALPKVVDAAG